MQEKIFFEQLPILKTLLSCGIEILVFLAHASLLSVLGLAICCVVYCSIKTIIDYFKY